MVYSSTDFIPTVAIDELSNNQIFPNGGTIDVSDNTIQRITDDSSNTYLEITGWNQNLSTGSSIANVFLNVENDVTNTRGADMIFKVYNDDDWQTACTTAVSNAGTFSCDLYNYGVDTVSEVNNLDVRIEVGDNNDGAAARLDIDYITLSVNSTTEANQSSETGTTTFSVQTNIFITLTDDAINLGDLTPNENKSSEDVNDWFTLRNDGALDFDVYAYGVNSPFTSTYNGANTLPNNYYFVHANSSDSGFANTTYLPVPANISTKTLLIDGLKKDAGFDTAKLGIKVIVPGNEEAGDKTADLVVYVEAD